VEAWLLLHKVEGREQHPGHYYPSGLLRTGDERKSDGERGPVG
ncbi:MAG: hypothetical protein RIQ78_862, partial [Bacteroidota bacterium]